MNNVQCSVIVMRFAVPWINYSICDYVQQSQMHVASGNAEQELAWKLILENRFHGKISKGMGNDSQRQNGIESVKWDFIIIFWSTLSPAESNLIVALQVIKITHLSMMMWMLMASQMSMSSGNFSISMGITGGWMARTEAITRNNAQERHNHFIANGTARPNDYWSTQWALAACLSGPFVFQGQRKALSPFEAIRIIAPTKSQKWAQNNPLLYLFSHICWIIYWAEFRIGQFASKWSTGSLDLSHLLLLMLNAGWWKGSAKRMK